MRDSLKGTGAIPIRIAAIGPRADIKPLSVFRRILPPIAGRPISITYGSQVTPRYLKNSGKSHEETGEKI